jgi:hypothetical protein
MSLVVEIAALIIRVLANNLVGDPGARRPPDVMAACVEG